ncbi:MAG: BNR-repeat neuraminidase N-terminal domain-containing protein, partial [Candidatus Goldiibacteriota bacterium]
MSAIFRILTVITAVFFGFCVYADVTGISKTDIEPYNMYALTSDNPVLRINISDNGSGDVLNSFAVKNLQNAEDLSEIASVKLYYNENGGDFDPDSSVFAGNLLFDSIDTWINTGLSLNVVEGSSVYAAIDIAGSPRDGYLTRFVLEAGSAVFLNGGSFGSSDIENTYSQSIVNATLTSTPTITQTATETVTGTATETVTETVTGTATETITGTMTETVTGTVTETVTETV